MSIIRNLRPSEATICPSAQKDMLTELRALMRENLALKEENLVLKQQLAISSIQIESIQLNKLSIEESLRSQIDELECIVQELNSKIAERNHTFVPIDTEMCTYQQNISYQLVGNNTQKRPPVKTTPNKQLRSPKEDLSIDSTISIALRHNRTDETLPIDPPPPTTQSKKDQIMLKYKDALTLPWSSEPSSFDSEIDSY